MEFVLPQKLKLTAHTALSCVRREFEDKLHRFGAFSWLHRCFWSALAARLEKLQPVLADSSHVYLATEATTRRAAANQKGR